MLFLRLNGIVEVTPYNEGTSFDPLYGFPNGRKERGKHMIDTANPILNGWKVQQ